MDKILNVHGLGRFQVDAFKILVLQHNVFAFFVLVTFDDLVPPDFLAIFFGHALVVDRTEITFA